MIRLARHIEILLLGNECVIVPNLGGFVAHRVCARYDENEELFLPPFRTLGFNAKLKEMNDSLLIQSYVEAYDMGYPEALTTIEGEVQELLDIMNESGSYELTNLGRLYYDKEGRMNFEPCESGILTPEFYALSSFEMPMVKAESKPAEATADVSEESSTKKPHVVYIGTENGRKTLNISLKAIRNVAVAAVAAIAVTMVSYPIVSGRVTLPTGNVESGFYEIFFPKHTNNGKAAAQFKVSKPVEAKKAAAPATVPTVVAKQQAQAEEQTATKEQQDKESADRPWSIVVCSHVSKKNAEALTGKLHENGFDEAYVSTDGAVKVLYGHYSTKTEALEKLNELNGGEYFKDAWLLEVKK